MATEPVHCHQPVTNPCLSLQIDLLITISNPKAAQMARGFCCGQVLFKSAAAAASEGGAALFYPHSYLFGFLKRRAELVAKAAGRSGEAGLDGVAARIRAEALCCAGGGCAHILRSYRCGGYRVASMVR